MHADPGFWIGELWMDTYVYIWLYTGFGGPSMGRRGPESQELANASMALLSRPITHAYSVLHVGYVPSNLYMHMGLVHLVG